MHQVASDESLLSPERVLFTDLRPCDGNCNDEPTVRGSRCRARLRHGSYSSAPHRARVGPRTMKPFRTSEDFEAAAALFTLSPLAGRGPG
jgi:hypothetical protein